MVPHHQHSQPSKRLIQALIFWARRRIRMKITAIKQGKAMLCKVDQGEPLVSMEGSRVDRISEFSE
jgi:hypothetical protein